MTRDGMVRMPSRRHWQEEYSAIWEGGGRELFFFKSLELVRALAPLEVAVNIWAVNDPVTCCSRLFGLVNREHE